MKRIEPNYTYFAVITGIYDGDSVDFDQDMGNSLKREDAKSRLIGFDTPEIRDKRKCGKEAARLVQVWLEKKLLGKKVVIISWMEKLNKKDKYGRFLLDIFYDDENGEQVHLNQEIVDLGYGKPYWGDTKTIWTAKDLRALIKKLKPIVEQYD